MPEDVEIIEGTKEEQYLGIISQIESLLEYETDQVANLANVAAVLKEQFKWLWVGFYVVKVLSPLGAPEGSNDPKHLPREELVVSAFQGPPACTRIRKGKGVCGESWAKNETLIVPDVEKFPGHIACSSSSRSEIVVPVRSHVDHSKVVGVLDVDSAELNTFDEVDALYLEKIAALLRLI